MQSVGVEVWTAQPEELGCGACTAMVGMLDAQERERASKLRFEEDRRAFVVAHAMRRMALGMALALDPQDLRFGTGPHGQPLLLGHEGRGLAFSLSRSRGLVAVAVATGGAVGIDVEAVRDGVDSSLLEPYVQLDAARPVRTDEEFYVQWTALEAYWKARGLGLSTAHPRIALGAMADDCWEVLWADPLSPAGMVIIRLPAGDGHVLALACESVVPIRRIELDSLAPAPRAQPQEALSGCKNRHCEMTAAPGLFSA